MSKIALFLHYRNFCTNKSWSQKNGYQLNNFCHTSTRLEWPQVWNRQSKAAIMKNTLDVVKVPTYLKTPHYVPVAWPLSWLFVNSNPKISCNPSPSAFKKRFSLGFCLEASLRTAVKHYKVYKYEGFLLDQRCTNLVYKILICRSWKIISWNFFVILSSSLPPPPPLLPSIVSVIIDININFI